MSDEQDPPRDYRADGLGPGKRVVYRVPGRASFQTGVIVGESRGDGHAWMIIKDGTKWPRGIHKSFCRPEKADLMMRD